MRATVALGEEYALVVDAALGKMVSYSVGNSAGEPRHRLTKCARSGDFSLRTISLRSGSSPGQQHYLWKSNTSAIKIATDKNLNMMTDLSLKIACLGRFLKTCSRLIRLERSFMTPRSLTLSAGCIESSVKRRFSRSSQNAKNIAAAIVAQYVTTFNMNMS